MFAHEVTGTYLETDNYNDNIGEAVQTWNADPLQTAKGWLGHLWYLEATSNGAYLITPGYALSLLGNSALNKVYVVPVRIWGDSPSLVHFWKRVPATV